jgi:hypothetical protein
MEQEMDLQSTKKSSGPSSEKLRPQIWVNGLLLVLLVLVVIWMFSLFQKPPVTDEGLVNSQHIENKKREIDTQRAEPIQATKPSLVSPEIFVKSTITDTIDSLGAISIPSADKMYAFLSKYVRKEQALVWAEAGELSGTNYSENPDPFKFNRHTLSAYNQLSQIDPGEMPAGPVYVEVQAYVSHYDFQNHEYAITAKPTDLTGVQTRLEYSLDLRWRNYSYNFDSSFLHNFNRHKFKLKMPEGRAEIFEQYLDPKRSVAVYAIGSVEYPNRIYDLHYKPWHPIFNSSHWEKFSISTKHSFGVSESAPYGYLEYFFWIMSNRHALSGSPATPLFPNQGINEPKNPGESQYSRVSLDIVFKVDYYLIIDRDDQIVAYATYQE